MKNRLFIYFVGGTLLFVYLYVYSIIPVMEKTTNSRLEINNDMIIDNGLEKNNGTVTSEKPVMRNRTGENAKHSIACHNDPSTIDGVQNLYSSNLTEQDELPIPDRSIFFHETSCFGDEGITITSRQACAVESAAMMNPKMTIYLLVLSPAKLSNVSINIARQLTAYDNVRIRRIYVEDYMKKTPLENWFSSKVIQASKWPGPIISDVLRYVTLWKFGGIYLDLDVVVTTTLDGLTNFSGDQGSNVVNSGVMGFGNTGLGRKFIEECLRNLMDNYRGDVWGYNGPGVITRTLQKMCNTECTEDMTKDRCQGFNVFPTSDFYPIPYLSWERYFERDETNETMKIIGNARAIHVWNKFSSDKIVKVGSHVPYDIVAEKYCPKVYRISGETF